MPGTDYILKLRDTDYLKQDQDSLMMTKDQSFKTQTIIKTLDHYDNPQTQTTTNDRSLEMNNKKNYKTLTMMCLSLYERCQNSQEKDLEMPLINTLIIKDHNNTQAYNLKKFLNMQLNIQTIRAFLMKTLRPFKDLEEMMFNY